MSGGAPAVRPPPGGLRLERVELSDEAWDRALAPWEAATFYHHSAWLRFLRDSTGGEVLRFRIDDGGVLRGWFSALQVRKGPFRILGSPLAGTLTEHMGPVAGPDLDVPAFLAALDRLCAAHRIHQLELGSPLLDPADLAAHGYAVASWPTLEIPLSPDPDALWSALRGKGRNRIRRGQRNGLGVEHSADPAFVDLHHAQLREVYEPQGLAPPHSIEALRSLFRNLEPAGLLYALQVRHAESGEIVATGLFPHDGRRAYSVSTASWRRARRLYPNELLYWTAMKRAGEAGLQTFRIGDHYRAPESGGRFKDKFNGHQATVHRFTRHRSALARWARPLYARWTRVKQRAGRPGRRGRPRPERPGAA
ncbi:MAG TPA: GNAT family N-acetyltransferase [Vicinamibacteria bacterium]|nr:GNAT family N-acetyltransferase [Vicinamibacteria bacterium]